MRARNVGKTSCANQQTVVGVIIVSQCVVVVIESV